jgi:hypothetical protein|tara:strand:+ start:321 stop:587 length:267 start_codon:yes stop_codon:yes gene_type:complete
MNDAFEEVWNFLAFTKLPESEQLRISRLKVLDLELQELKGSAKHNKQQWLECKKYGAEDDEQREARYKNAVIKIKAINAEITQLGKGN